ncbi:S-adenosyl-L-methionine-dependent tRNA 4-demethylwyosine synthase [Tyrophagus putrescentiae]|nr:S-adenosyl-L-methionine-dependent tRNA 4-demethylwyosine synthase [Tyrophagus putrescentiae]
MKSKLLEYIWRSLSESPLLLRTVIAGAVVVISSRFYYQKLSSRRSLPSSADDYSKCNGVCACKKGSACGKKKLRLRIICGSIGGKSERLSRKCFDLLNTDSQICSLYDVEWLPIAKYDPEDELINDAKLGSYLIVFMPTYTNGEPHPDAKWFCKWISEASSDFRFASDELKQLKFAIFGIGDSAYGNEFCLLARNLNDWLSKMKADRFYPTCLLDTSSQIPAEKQFSSWFEELSPVLVNGSNGLTSSEDGADVDGDEAESGEYDDEDDDGANESRTNVVTDLEDIVKPVSSRKTANGSAVGAVGAKKITDMITPDLRKELTKQGYKLIGSHSGVKLCRWTKSMLRGRGGCYKNAFYGIESHRCMEATPSLACANKCVFCWRHHTNPVGTEWKWNLDEPELIVEGALKSHYAMINEFKGVPGVQEGRLKEASTARHCALSLVGEPIMYPKINAFVKLLHERGVSTFLVTNAQFPDAIRALDPVTQLYVSVDASSKASLKKIDRPLFRDFWERFIDSLKALGEKGQRTVYRLTLVKSWNSDDVEGYARLVSFGFPDFIEIKGVTFCGNTSSTANLTMKNVPWHEEVVSFGTALMEKINQMEAQKQLGLKGSAGFDATPLYGIACEHEHSNCILLAHRRFHIDGAWNTWIDYAKFSQLIGEYYQSNGEKTFSSLDYVQPTPAWAVYGASERGFNPNDTRFRRNK